MHRLARWWPTRCANIFAADPWQFDWLALGADARGTPIRMRIHLLAYRCLFGCDADRRPHPLPAANDDAY